MNKILISLLALPLAAAASIEENRELPGSCHGIAVPLSALRSKKDCGIGEFLDVISLVDWCKEVNLDVIQFLPLNDTGSDPSPYNPISSCALHPIYLSLHALPYLERLPVLQEELSSFEELNSLPRVSYHEVQERKLSWLRKYFQEVGLQLVQEEAYLRFIEDNSWVLPYALFKVLKEQNDQKNWADWDLSLRSPSLEEFELLLEENEFEVSFYCVLQYLSSQQLKQVKDYAASKDVLLKGDVSILISRDSADCWAEPKLFDFTLAVGAPPDKNYNEDGQYWGFPLYNWEEMKAQEYCWWKQRIGSAAQYFDLYRIDHATGFFRIWAIPLNGDPKEGKYLPENPELWLPQGKEILGALKGASSMLAISEDIPSGVDEDVLPFIQKALREVGIYGTKIIRWEKNSDGSFAPLNEYSRASMTSISNHDIEPLQLWWQKFPEEASLIASMKNWTYSPLLTREQRLELLKDSHQSGSFFHINPIQEYLAFFPELIWEKPENERINIPGTVLPSNWAYRIRVHLEELAVHNELKETMQQIFP